MREAKNLPVLDEAINAVGVFRDPSVLLLDSNLNFNTLCMVFDVHKSIKVHIHLPHNDVVHS